MSGLKLGATVLMIIGGLNWGLVGLFQFDLVAALFGNLTMLSRIIYGLVGLSAVASLFVLIPDELNELAHPPQRTANRHG